MTKPVHSLSPQELAALGIPVEVALRARVEDIWQKLSATDPAVYSERLYRYDLGRARGLELALAIIEAKR